MSPLCFHSALSVSQGGTRDSLQQFATLILIFSSLIGMYNLQVPEAQMVFPKSLFIQYPREHIKGRSSV